LEGREGGGGKGEERASEREERKGERAEEGGQAQ
jgi:hypothetical protein